MNRLLGSMRAHPVLSAVLVTGALLTALEIPYLVLARSDSGRLRTLSAVSAPHWENRPAPTFALPAIDGSGTVGLRPASRVTVVNFWASWCTACRAEAPDLEAVSREQGPAVRFLGVDEGDRLADARSFIRTSGITYPSGFDPKERAASRYGIFGLPYTFVIDRSGRIRAEFAGRIAASSLTRVLGIVRGP